MRHIFLSFLLGWILFLPQAAHAGELGFLEKFVLSLDKKVALKKLLPGTRDAFYYKALYYQSKGELDRVDQILAQWEARFQYDSRRTEIEYRQALLRYAKHPEVTLEFLKKKLYLSFQDRKRVRGKRQFNYPSTLDSSSISRETLKKKALSDYSSLYGFEPDALEWLSQTKDLDIRRVRELLRSLSRPDVNGLVDLILTELNDKDASSFGTLEIHKRLLLPQLMELLQKRPSLLNDGDFINACLRKLRPGNDDSLHDAATKRAYLERLWGFVSTLQNNQNSLKLHVLYHILKLDRAEGKRNDKRFLEYIKLPRYAPYANGDYVKSHRYHTANLYASFDSLTMLPRIGNDEPLIRAYLMDILVNAKDTSAFSEFLKQSYLKRVFAETKLVNGVGEASQWYSMLSAAGYKALQERVDIDFAPTNPKYFAPIQDVSLDVYVKNVKTLLVKVYRINAFNYYRKYKRNVNTALSLDGLVANQEQVFTYDEVPLRRVKRQFKFAKLSGRGVYIVDFIGNGKSSRVLVQKGQLRYVSRTSVAGQILTVLDEDGNPLKDATLWMQGKEYQPRKDGTIVLPFTNRPGKYSVILQHKGFFSLAKFNHLSENYQFTAGIYVDREALLARNRASVVIRPSLFVSGVRASLKIVESSILKLTSTDRFGVQSSKTVENFKLFDDKESTYLFRVPEGLRRLDVFLSIKVKKLSDNGKEQTFTSNDSFTVNDIDQGNRLDAFLLRKIKGIYVLDLLDRTGIGQGSRRVSMQLKHRWFRSTIYATLQTDDKGSIQLGSLDEIQWLSVQSAGTSRKWTFGGERRNLPSRVHAQEGEVISVPYIAKAPNTTLPSREALSLLEVRKGEYYKDHYSAIQYKDGFLVVSGLLAGDYDLYLKDEGKRVRIRVTKGTKHAGYIIGKHRMLQQHRGSSLHISNVQVDDKAVRIQLSGVSMRARVHVIATRYVPDFDVYGHLGKMFASGLSQMFLGRLRSHYQVGRVIGDEYRYILERRYAKVFPGVMLKRPSLLLNPWAKRKTQTDRQTARRGSRFFGNLDSEGMRGTFDRHARLDSSGGETTGLSANLDFLSASSVLLSNLRANEKGEILVDRKALGAHSHIHIVAIDPDNTVYRELSLEDMQTSFKDLRLLSALSPKKHYTQQRKISLVQAKESFVIADVISAKFESYDSLESVYRLLNTLSKNSTLAEFSFLMQWPTLNHTQKLEKYSKYACHELNFFIFKKDHDFFMKVVLPYIQNKKDKTFLDHWLIGAEMQGYLKPWNFQRLNVVERILLSQRYLREQKIGVNRHVREQNAMRPPNIRYLNQLFDTAIQASALDSSVNGTVVDELSKAPLQPAKPAIVLPSGSSSYGIGGGGRYWRGAGKFGGRRWKMAKRRAITRGFLKSAPADPSAGKDGDSGDIDLRRKEEAKQYYQQLEKTQEWAENNYYKLPIEQQVASLVTVNDFWNDLAQFNGNGNFYSTHIAQASRNFTEMVFALSVLDLPFKPSKHKTSFSRAKMTVVLGSPALYFHKQILPASAPKHKSPILVSQRYFRDGYRYKYVNGQRQDRFVRDEFLVHVVYGTQVVVTNPSSTRYKLDLLLQIPQGAMPVRNGQRTESKLLQLGAYETRRFVYYYYFPKKGVYTHFPAHVSKEGKLLAWTQSDLLKVVDEPTKIDKQTWDYISQNGTDKEVFDYLKSNNLFRVNLNFILWRAQNKAFYDKLKSLLQKRFVYHGKFWSYSVKHNDADGISQLLQHANYFVNRCGQYLQSPLLTIDPVVRHLYEHLEYSPLVNARAHQLGKTRKIVNDRFFQQYNSLLGVLKYKESLDADDWMALTYYLLLQDRVHEALGIFAKVDASKLKTRLQYDYFAAYMAFFTADLQKAKKIAEAYKEYPVLRWRRKFEAVLSQLAELEGKQAKTNDPKDRTQRHTKLADKEASFHFKVEDRNVTISYQNVSAFRVNYYLMDIELLFSRNPFLGRGSGGSGQFAFIQPNLSELHKTTVAGRGKLKFNLPKQFHSSNVMVEVLASGLRKARAYYANTLDVQVMTNYGQLKVREEGTNKPLSKVYVKVYARKKNGRVEFYKDGYTDLRGRFDYSSLSTNDLDQTARFSILILSKKYGAVVREANPPKQ